MVTLEISESEFEIEVDWQRFGQFIAMHTNDIDLGPDHHLVINLDDDGMVLHN